MCLRRVPAETSATSNVFPGTSRSVVFTPVHTRRENRSRHNFVLRVLVLGALNFACLLHRVARLVGHDDSSSLGTATLCQCGRPINGGFLLDALGNAALCGRNERLLVRLIRR
jgi:hypothetical protein